MQLLNHKTVFLKESIELLNVKENGVFIDCTLGSGGHSLELLKKIDKTSLLISFDKDKKCIDHLFDFSTQQQNWKLVHDDFCNFDKTLKSLQILKIDGAILDLGISSMQLDDPQRGFSYKKEGGLDMRMDESQTLNAFHVVNNYSQQELENIFKLYADSKFAYQISKAIVNKREQKPINSTLELAEIIKNSVPHKFKWNKHPAKTIFQAIRIEVNSEIKSLTVFLQKIINYLNKNAVLVFISFHSLEDKVIKNFFDKQIYRHAFINQQIMQKLNPDFKWIKKIKPSTKDISENSRSHSAYLRAIKYVGGEA